MERERDGEISALGGWWSFEWMEIFSLARGGGFGCLPNKLGYKTLFLLIRLWFFFFFF